MEHGDTDYECPRSASIGRWLHRHRVERPPVRTLDRDFGYHLQSPRRHEAECAGEERRRTEGLAADHGSPGGAKAHEEGAGAPGLQKRSAGELCQQSLLLLRREQSEPDPVDETESPVLVDEGEVPLRRPDEIADAEAEVVSVADPSPPRRGKRTPGDLGPRRYASPGRWRSRVGPGRRESGRTSPSTWEVAAAAKCSRSGRATWRRRLDACRQSRAFEGFGEETCQRQPVVDDGWGGRYNGP